MVTVTGAQPGDMFRAMRLEIDGLPKLGRSARELGVRINVDLPVGADGSVEPGTGGMSVAVDDALNLPKHRRPRSLGGEGRDSVFGLQTRALPDDLALRVDQRPHAFVEPARRSALPRYEAALALTRSSWTRIDG